MWEIQHHDSRTERHNKRKWQFIKASAVGVAAIAALVALGTVAGRWIG